MKCQPEGLFRSRKDAVWVPSCTALFAEPEKLKMYRQKALMRGKAFKTEVTVEAVSQMMCTL